MSSSSDGEFLSSYLSIVAAAAIIAALMLAVVVAPLLALAAVPAVAFLYYRNSPQTKEREARERTEAIFREAKALATPNREQHIDRIFAELEEPARKVAFELYEEEGFDPPPPVPPVCNSVEGARYRDALLKYMENAHDPKRADRFMDALMQCMPRYPPGKGIFQAWAQLTNEDVERLIVPFYDHEPFFAKLRLQIDRNYTEQKEVMPSDYKGDNCAWAYLKQTPLLQLEKRTYSIGLSHRTEHHQIVGGSGSGKTSMLEYMIANDLNDDCTVIVIDSQRTMIERLAHLDLPIEDVAYISPRHKLHINLFDVKAHSEEDVIAITDLVEYVLSGLMGADLTPMQTTLFNYAVQLLMEIEGGNLSTFRTLLRKDGWLHFIHEIAKLPQVARDFFEHEFNQREYDGTKQQIMWRIDAMQRNPAFARIFDARKNPIDMYAEMAKRKLILIDTNVNRLGDHGSSFFGRLFIALILRAARQRFTGSHRPCYVYIDECAAYLDSRLELMLQQARKANIGLILAHQDLEKARSAGILTAILGNTATKFAGRMGDADARTMAANMRTTAEFIKSLSPYHFAASMIGEPTTAISARPDVIDRADKRRDYMQLIAKMEARYGSQPEPKAKPDTESVGETPDEDIPDGEIEPSRKL